jgi:nitric oxide reductase large subunit
VPGDLAPTSGVGLPQVLAVAVLVTAVYIALSAYAAWYARPPAPESLLAAEAMPHVMTENQVQSRQ